MDEEITIIDTNARNERIKNFFIDNKKKLIIIISIILLIIIGYLSFENSREKNKIKLANQYNLALIDLNPENKQKTIDEMVKEIIPTINIKIQSDVNINIRKKVISEEEKVRKKTEMTEDERCMARTVYEDKHLEDSGFLKVMRDDNKNLYGDRCKCRKKDGSLFCTRHSGFQPLGVWNGEYYGKLLDFVNKTVNGNTCNLIKQSNIELRLRTLVDIIIHCYIILKSNWKIKISFL